MDLLEVVALIKQVGKGTDRLSWLLKIVAAVSIISPKFPTLSITACHLSGSHSNNQEAELIGRIQNMEWRITITYTREALLISSFTKLPSGRAWPKKISLTLLD